MKTPRSNDDRISAMIGNSDRIAMNPKQEAEANAWLAARTAIVRRSHQLFPAPPQGDDEMISARSNYVKSRMNCEPHYVLHVPSPYMRSQMEALRASGMSLKAISRKLGFDCKTVRKVVR